MTQLKNRYNISRKETYGLSGTYVIYFVNCNWIYIGSTSNAYSRFCKHISSLQNNTHHCRLLQIHFNEYGYKALRFKVIEQNIYEKEDLIKSEKSLISFFDNSKGRMTYNTNRLV